MSNKQKIAAMTAGGQKLAQIKNQLVTFAHQANSLEAIEDLAGKLIKKTNGQSSFKMVPGYHWNTCININAGIVHGIPKGSYQPGDLLTIDVGLFFDGFHTDTSTSFMVGKKANHQISKFLKTGQQTLTSAINQAMPGHQIKDISHTIQKQIEAAGYNVVRDLTGHGVGQDLHMDPAIPCFVSTDPNLAYTIRPGDTLAIEVMYTAGNWPLVLASDNWTLTTQDGSLSAVFEETVLVTKKHPQILTQNHA